MTRRQPERQKRNRFRLAKLQLCNVKRMTNFVFLSLNLDSFSKEFNSGRARLHLTKRTSWDTRAFSLKFRRPNCHERSFL